MTILFRALERAEGEGRELHRFHLDSTQPSASFPAGPAGMRAAEAGAPAMSACVPAASVGGLPPLMAVMGASAIFGFILALALGVVAAPSVDPGLAASAPEEPASSPVEVAALPAIPEIAARPRAALPMPAPTVRSIPAPEMQPRPDLPEDRPELVLALARTLASEGEYLRAHEAYGRAHASGARASEVLDGWLPLHESLPPETARASLKGLRGLYPDDPAVLAQFGFAAIRAGDPAAAAPAFERAASLQPGNPVHLFNAATAHDRLGHATEAHYYYGLALERGADRLPVGAIRARMQSLADAGLEDLAPSAPR